MSLLEVTVVVTIVTILSFTLVTTFTGTRDRAVDSESERLLHSVAATQQQYHLSRGVFATDAGSLDRISDGEVVLTTGPSTSSKVVSVANVTYDGLAMLGLAVMSSSGRCVTLLVPEPGVDSSFDAVRHDVSVLCTGAQAVVP